MRVLVAVAFAGSQSVDFVELPEGATVADALAAARVAERFEGIDLANVGVWGRRREPGAALREGDRVELYRPATADAKAMRRERERLRRATRSRNGP